MKNILIINYLCIYFCKNKTYLRISVSKDKQKINFLA